MTMENKEFCREMSRLLERMEVMQINILKKTKELECLGKCVQYYSENCQFDDVLEAGTASMDLMEAIGDPFMALSQDMETYGKELVTKPLLFATEHFKLISKLDKTWGNLLRYMRLFNSTFNQIDAMLIEFRKYIELVGELEDDKARVMLSS